MHIYVVTLNPSAVSVLGANNKNRPIIVYLCVLYNLLVVKNDISTLDGLNTI